MSTGAGLEDVGVPSPAPWAAAGDELFAEPAGDGARVAPGPVAPWLGGGLFVLVAAGAVVPLAVPAKELAVELASSPAVGPEPAPEAVVCGAGVAEGSLVRQAGVWVAAESEPPRRAAAFASLRL